MRRPHRPILAVVLGLGLVITGLSVASARLGPTIDGFVTARTMDGVAVNTTLAVTFTESMDRPATERGFHITPRVRGDFSWSGNQLLFLPRSNLAYTTTYSVSIGAPARAAGGRNILRTYRTTFRTQAEHFLYIGTSGRERSRLVLASETGDREIVGVGSGGVHDFSVSADHSLAVYSRQGAPSERTDEIWLLSLADNSTQRILRRPDWSISQPHLSPDGRLVAFLAGNVRLCRRYYGCYRDTSAPIVYVLDLRSHKLTPFNSASDVPITDFLDFSPAGQLAFTDLGSALTLADPGGGHIVHIPNSGNSLEFAGFDAKGDKAVFVGQTPDSSGGDVLVFNKGRYVDVSRGVYDSAAPSLSPSGAAVAFSAYRSERGIEPVYGIDIYSFARRRRILLTSERDWSDWAPQWSPDGRYIAFVRSKPQEAMYMGSGEIWVMGSNGQDPRPVASTGMGVTWVG